jgi:hypothetical protein
VPKGVKPLADINAIDGDDVSIKFRLGQAVVTPSETTYYKLTPARIGGGVTSAGLFAPRKPRINELARELEIKAHEILDILPELGCTENKTHSSSIPEEIAHKVRLRFGTSV